MLHCCSFVFAKRPVSQGYDGGRKDANVKKQQHRMACVHCTSVYVCACVCICVYTYMFMYVQILLYVCKYFYTPKQ